MHTPLGLCGVTAGKGGRTRLSAACMANFRGIVQASTTCGDRRRQSCCLRILACPFCVGSLKPAIIVETGVGPLLTISGRCPGKDLGIEFPDELRPEPAVGGSLDEALKPEHQFVVQRALGIPWTRQKNCQSSLTQRRMLKSLKLYCCSRTSTPG